MLKKVVVVCVASFVLFYMACGGSMPVSQGGTWSPYKDNPGYKALPDRSEFYAVDVPSEPLTPIDVPSSVVEECIRTAKKGGLKTSPPADLYVQYLSRYGIGVHVKWVDVSGPGWAEEHSLGMNHRDEYGGKMACIWTITPNMNKGGKSKTDAVDIIIPNSQKENSGSQENSSQGGAECRMNSDCAAGKYCKDNSCTTDCREDRDCSSGLSCDANNGRCVTSNGMATEPEQPASKEAADSLVY
jgi:hypothetical protein